jgi:hypothetical protein
MLCASRRRRERQAWALGRKERGGAEQFVLVMHDANGRQLLVLYFSGEKVA